jgi:hypothetical protein
MSRPQDDRNQEATVYLVRLIPFYPPHNRHNPPHLGLGQPRRTMLGRAHMGTHASGRTSRYDIFFTFIASLASRSSRLQSMYTYPKTEFPWHTKGLASASF